MTINLISSEPLANTHDDPLVPDWLHGGIQAQYIVSLPGRHGLHEALGEADDGRWIFRSLNVDGLPLVYAHPNEARLFDLPVSFAAAALDRSLIVVLVNGDDFDVTDDGVHEPAPLFQDVHASGLAHLAGLAMSAGFTEIEITNGYDATEQSIQELLDELSAALDS